MERYYSQPIPRFAKLNHPAYCAIAYSDTDTESFCRNFFLALMDRKNCVVFETDVIAVIHALTSWKKDTIKKAIQRLVKREELVRTGHKKIQYNPYFANRVIAFDQFRLGYKGGDAQFSPEQRRIVEEIERLIKTETTHAYTERDEEMEALKEKVASIEEKMTRQTEILEFLMARAKGEDVETAKTMLRLVKNDD